VKGGEAVLDDDSLAWLHIQLKTLFNLLGKPDALPVVEALIRRILKRVTAKGRLVTETPDREPVDQPYWEVTEVDAPNRKLLRPDWEQYWHLHHRIARAWFDDRAGSHDWKLKKRCDAQLRVFEGMIALILDPESADEKKDLAKRLRSRIRRYLLLRRVPLREQSKAPVTSGRNAAEGLVGGTKATAARKRKKRPARRAQATRLVPPREPLTESRINWTGTDSPARWAKKFGVSRATFVRHCKEGKIRNKRLSTKSYQIAVDDLPLIHQQPYRASPSAPPSH
jgi:hypothetical protein